MSGHSRWGNNYGSYPNNDQGRHPQNFGYNYRPSGNSSTCGSNFNSPNYGFRNQNQQRGSEFGYPDVQESNTRDYGFSDQNFENRSAPDYGFSNQNHQWTPDNLNGNFSNSGETNARYANNVSDDNYYGMASNDSCMESSSFNELTHPPVGNNNNRGGKNKKGVKRPLPDDPKDRKRIKKNNRNNKRNKMVNSLRGGAVGKVPAGIDVTKFSKSQLRKIASVTKGKMNAQSLNELSKGVLMAMVATHVSEKVNLQAFTKRGLRAFLRQVDPNFKALTNVEAPVGKKSLQRWIKAEKIAANIVEANKRAQEPLDEQEADGLASPIAIETVYMRKVSFEEGKKLQKFVSQKAKKMNPTTIRGKYNILKANPVLDYNGLALAGFLRYALFEIFPEKRVHAMLLCDNLLSHRNVLKFLQFEVKKLLDAKFESDIKSMEKRRALLVSFKAKVLEDDEHFFQDGNGADRAFIMDGCIDILCANEYPPELIPTPSDHMKDPSKPLSPEESTLEYQLLFLSHMYESLGFVITDKLSGKDRVKFHLDNPIIAALFVEFVRSYGTYVETNPFHMFSVKPGDCLAIPAAINDYVARKNNIGYCRSPELGKLYTMLRENNWHVQTKVLEVLPDDMTPSTILLQNFSNLVLFSDEFFSLARYRLMQHTPHLSLSSEQKSDIFNGLLKKTYKKAFNIWESKLTMHDITFKDITGRPLEPDNAKI